MTRRPKIPVIHGGEDVKSHHFRIRATYNAACSQTVELNQPWENVRDWGVKWDTLHVTYKDGTKQEVEMDNYALEAVDWKRPSNVSVYKSAKGEDLYDEELDCQ